jgi:ribonuclease Z
MTLSRIARLVVILGSAAFAVVALTFWAAPMWAAHVLGIEAIRPGGIAAVQTELGGLFAGLAVLCGAAAWTNSGTWAIPSAAVLSAIVVSRAIGWTGNGDFAAELPALAVELVVIAALWALARGSASAVPAQPRRAWRPIATGALLIMPAAGGVALMNPALQQRAFDAAARQRAGSINMAPLEDDALRIAICGSSAPLPSAPRAKACVAVFAGGKFYVVDVGPESVENLVLWGIPLSSIGGVMLTHFHSDHIGDLGELNLQTWAGGRSVPLAVYGGPGIEQVVDGFNAAYRLDQGYRTKHHTERVMPPATWPMAPHTVHLAGAETSAMDRTAVVLDDGVLRVTAIEVDHAPIAPAYAYRFDYKGRSVLVTGDLKFNPSLVKAAKGVDVMVSEAISTRMTRSLGAGAKSAGRSGTAAIMHDIEDYHITPEQAAGIANDANIKLLVFYHLLPSPDGFLARKVFESGIGDARRGEWTISDDGSLYTLPMGSDTVRIGSIVTGS